MPNPLIHPTAIVSPAAKLGDGVNVQPYAIIHDHVEIGANSVIGSHAVIHDFVRMGADNKVHSHAVIGDLPQSISFDVTTETWVEIGDNNTFRESATIHRATDPATTTRLGSNSYLMANSHIGHDCQVGDNVIVAINCAIGGHVEVGNNVVFGGAVVVHQFCRIGAYAMLAGFVAIRKDVLPYSMTGGEPVRHYRLNTVGLKRAGITGERYKTLESAYRAIRAGDRSLHGIEQTDEIEYLRNWLSTRSKRGLIGFV
jgi:UDP-N-acetylglucosamine acyltransferase